MIRCGVVGNPIAHSLSPVIHQQFAEQAGISLSYEKIEGDPLSFEDQIRHFFKEKGKGLNITLPFKQRAYAMAAVKTSRCEQAKAANTLWIQDEVLQADNTDGIGLVNDLARHLDLTDKTILIIGAGGAARGIIAPLLAANAQLTVLNRTFEKAKDLASSFPQINCASYELLNLPFDLVINATSAGVLGEELMFPKGLLETKPFCYDLSYRRQELTPFVAAALKQGCMAIDGLGMLVEQAAEAFYIWHGFKPDTVSVLDYLRSNSDTTSIFNVKN